LFLLFVFNSMLMYAFGVTLWEIFSSHVPYDNDKKPAQELIEELKDLLTDADDPLRPDLDLVDPRVRQLLQVSSLALKSFLSLPTAHLFNRSVAGPWIPTAESALLTCSMSSRSCRAKRL
jgi:hypothetical protein